MSISTLPDISIIMPCYNAATHLPESVGSVLAQTFVNWELIAIDDGSSDNTLAWLSAQTDPRIRVHAQTNQGASLARNAGIAMARGRHIAFLDADDTWDPAFLNKMLAALASNNHAVLAYCGWQKRGRLSDPGLPFVPPDYENSDKLETLFTGCRWPIHAAVVKRDAVIVAGGFDPELKNAEDYALWLRVASTAPIVLVPEVLAYYHFHEGMQASSNRARAALHHLKAQRRFLAHNPDFEIRIGRKHARNFMMRKLLSRGYGCYWQRDLPAAREIFRAVMKQGYGTLKDWKYMLPAWLPLSWHQRLIGFQDKARRKPGD